MSLHFQSNGVLTTLQDLGRIGYRRFGVNPNGVMDRKAMRLINILLGNDENEAVLEIHFPAPRILFEKAAVVALGGADFGAKIAGKSLENWRPCFVERGQGLVFSDKIKGNRLYLSVKNGFITKKFLAGASTNLKAGIGGFEGRSIQKGDRLFCKTEIKNRNEKYKYRISDAIIPKYRKLPEIRVIEGAEAGFLNGLSELNFYKKNYKITTVSDRMGFRLSGEPLFLSTARELVSTGVNFGTIQLLPNGQLIVLMADAQTTGGYPRIAHIISDDLPIIAQLGANDEIRFKQVSVQIAEESALAFEREINLLKIGINNKPV